MSPYSDGHSKHSSVPPSAQPYRSLFGGSSQGTFEQERYLDSQQDRALDDFDVGAIGSGGRKVEYEESDVDLAYLPSEDEGSESESAVHPLLKYEDTHTKIIGNRGRPGSSSLSAPYRPNRFHGPPDLWLNLTRDDREIVNALEDIRARDLAAHLYNAHALQSQGILELDESEAKDIGFDDDDLFNILEAWTAWPMPSDEVPRADERLRRLEDDKWTFRMKPDSRPSAGLEESIIAVLLKTAKERFQSRRSRRSNTRDGKGPALSDTDGARSGMETDFEGIQPSVNNTLHSGSRADHDMSHRSTYKSDPDDRISATEWETELESSEIPLRPVVQIDDDKSRRQLRPLARNVITQFERLLLGLHSFHGASQSDDHRSNRSRSRGRKRARSSSVLSSMSSANDRGIPTEDASGTEHHTSPGSVRPSSKSSRKGGTESKPENGHSRGRKRTRRTSQSSRRNSAHVKSVHTSNTSGRSRSRSRSISTDSDGQPRLTNWRDVAGMASLIGFSPTVLQHATERFSALTGEDTVAPTMPEEPDRQFMESVSNWLSTESELAALGRDESLSHSPHRRRLPSSRVASSRRRSTSKAARALPQPADKESSSREASPNKGTTLVCPLKWCHRHTKGFSRRWNLNQHLKTMHPGYVPKENRSQTRSGMQSGYDSDMSE
ncbi:RNA polymerase I-specific transcription initiation factor-domain-containing protein [Aspergillus spectabilis]